jgi:peptidoglycan/LPS O-acetylase OafA/YrhL
MSEPAPRFSPLTVAARPRRIAVALIGPLLWLAGFVLVAIVADETDAIAYGLAIAAASFVVATVTLIPMRNRRNREEAERPGSDH